MGIELRNEMEKLKKIWMGRGRGDKRNTGIGIHRIVLKTDSADIEIKIVRLKQVLLALGKSYL